jgi:hypothetical protein
MDTTKVKKLRGAIYATAKSKSRISQPHQKKWQRQQQRRRATRIPSHKKPPKAH